VLVENNLVLLMVIVFKQAVSTELYAELCLAAAIVSVSLVSC